jgi:hypothetical protein
MQIKCLWPDDSIFAAHDFDNRTIPFAGMPEQASPERKLGYYVFTQQGNLATDQSFSNEPAAQAWIDVNKNSFPNESDFGGPVERAQ